MSAPFSWPLRLAAGAVLVIPPALVLGFMLARSSGGDPAPSVEAYEYRFSVTPPVPSGARSAPLPERLAFNGRELTRSNAEAVSLPAADWVTAPGATFTATVATTCGRHEIELENERGYDAEHEARMRSDSVRYRQEISWHLVPRGEWPTAISRQLYVDNLDGERPARVSVGAASFEVAPKTAEHHTVQLGDCREATTVRVDDRVVGKLSPSFEALVDVGGGHCYRTLVAGYGSMGGASGVHFFGKPGQRLYELAVVDNIFTENAETVTVRVETRGKAQPDLSGVGTTRSSLQRSPCPTRRSISPPLEPGSRERRRLRGARNEGHAGAREPS